LRRKILNRMRPKTHEGENLNGYMLVGLIHSYVEAINNGAIPNIENAWDFICENECRKASE